MSAENTSTENNSKTTDKFPPVAITSRSFSRHTQLRTELLAAFPGSKFNDEGKVLAGEELIAFLQNSEKAIIALEKIDDKILSALPKLKTISKYGVGLDSIDLEAMQKRGVKLGWTPGVNRRSVSELALCLMITTLRKVGASFLSGRSGIWKQFKGRQLSESTVGVIGYGHIGRDLARLLHSFGTTVIAYDIKDKTAEFREDNTISCTLSDLISKADIITLHVPYDASTANLINHDAITSMKEGAIIINTARGGIVDESAAFDALRSGRLGGMACDVFEQEPPAYKELLDLPNFYFTTHIGGSSEEAILNMGRAAIAGLSQAHSIDNYL